MCLLQVWSVIFHNWLTLVFLLVACITLVTPRKHHTVLFLSPAILTYAIAMMCMQYVYSLQLKDEELPTELAGGFHLAEYGLKKSEHPVYNLLIQVCDNFKFTPTLEWNDFEPRDININFIVEMLVLQVSKFIGIIFSEFVHMENIDRDVMLLRENVVTRSGRAVIRPTRLDL